MLLELAIGDAYGAGFEYAPRELVATQNDLSGYVRHPRHRMTPGAYTDDTQMSLAIAELIVEEASWTPEVIAAKFVEVFKRDPREGYARGFYQFLQEISSGAEFLKKIRPHSDKSGAAMRAAPIGVFASIDEVKERATVQARLTHDTPDGIGAAVAAALMAHYFLHRLGPQQELGAFLEDHVPGRWNSDWSGKVRSKGWMSVRAALTAIRKSARMSSLLQACVAFTGDTDTVATIALAAGAHCPELNQDLPQRLIDELENGDYGREYIMKLDRQLLERLQPRKASADSLLRPAASDSDRRRTICND